VSTAAGTSVVLSLLQGEPGFGHLVIFISHNAGGISLPGRLIHLNKGFISRTFQKSGEKESLVAHGKM
jgi:hypothetical protein